MYLLKHGFKKYGGIRQPIDKGFATSIPNYSNMKYVLMFFTYLLVFVASIPYVDSAKCISSIYRSFNTFKLNIYRYCKMETMDTLTNLNIPL